MPQNELSFEIDCYAVSQKIEEYIRNYVRDSNTQGVLLGLSGGIDSAVSAALAVRAVGKDKVMAFILPNPGLDSSFEDDARYLAKQIAIPIVKIPLDLLANAFKSSIDQKMLSNQLVLGNAYARLRMILLYAYANYLGYLVLGTSNKTEIMVGYITKYGDGGVDFEPCGGLYKTEIRLLANYLEIPENIIKKPPSAGFWVGQTDEGELGITYELLDKILLGIEKGFTSTKICKLLEIESEVVAKVKNMIEKSEHKRKMPPILEL